MDVYSDIFYLGYGLIQKEGEAPGSFKANPIAYWKNKGDRHGHFRIMFEDTFGEVLKELQEADFAILNGLTYFGKRNVQAHASKMFAMIIDLDGVTDGSLDNFLHGCYVKEWDLYPLPNYLVLSGHGVHLYYLFEHGIPLYPNIKLQLKEFKYSLIGRVWNRYSSTLEKPQFQGINQGFRVIGGRTKIPGVRARAYELSRTPYCLENLGEYIPEEKRIGKGRLWKESMVTLDEARELYPEWYKSRVEEGHGRRRWKCNRALYDWWKRQVQEHASYGHRYFSVMCLAIYGAKCGIPYDEVEEDAMGFIPCLSSLNLEKPFTEEDCMAALECYDERYCTFPRKDMEKLSGIPFPVNKRNGRKRSDHVRLMNFVRDEINHNTGWNKSGNGRKTKKGIVEQWQKEHPNGHKAECIQGTGLSKPTVYKWWKG